MSLPTPRSCGALAALIPRAPVAPVLALMALWAAGWSQPLAAQSPAEEVVAVVERLFDGMRARDRAMLESVFHESARLMGAGEREGEPFVSETPIARFIETVASSEGALLDERIYDPEVRVDGNLATVWVAYDFYRGEEFSHCGYDAFQLARTGEGWKIIQVADTRRVSGCPER